LGYNIKNAELLPQDQARLRETLQAADVLLWVATTLGVDAAALDRPQIMVNFDGFETRPYLKSVRKFHDEDHMKKLVATGGAHVARSKQELAEWINKYLDDPSLDADKRKKIVESQIVYTDGKSGERFAQAIISAANRAKTG
jgi:CDP-glycerol glycerophosphotransferase (TagB/SpsB family)